MRNAMNIKNEDISLPIIQSHKASVPVKSHFPYDQRGPRRSAYFLNTIKVEITGELFARIDQISNGIDHTLHMILMTAAAIQLGKHSKRSEVIVSMPEYRQNEDEPRIIKIRCQFTESQSFKECLLQMRQTIIGAIEKTDQNNQEASTDVLVLLEGIHEKNTSYTNANIRFVFKKMSEHLECYLEYNTSLYRKVTAELISENFKTLLSFVLFNVNTSLSQVNFEKTFIKRGFDCFIIGGSTLPIRCAEILLDNGNEIFGIISDDRDVKTWCQENNILHCHFRQEDIFDFCNQASFDYFLSINNPHYVSKEVLSLPKQYAINYHDALLPKYAGRFATSWALVNHENEHGVSWHLLNESFDTGDIVKQARVSVDEDETAFSLNIKCYEAAVKSFEEFVNHLASDRPLTITKQDLNKRTYFGFSERAQLQDIISWNSNAEQIDALVRAANFGNYENPFVTSKILLNEKLFIVSDAAIEKNHSDLPPGTISSVTDSLMVSTRTHDVRITRLKSLDGQDVSIRSVVDELALFKGMKLKDPNEEFIKKISQIHTYTYKSEAFWVNRLHDLQPLILPYTTLNALNTTVCKRDEIAISIKEFFIEDKKPEGEVLLVSFLAYLARLTNTFLFNIGFRDESLQLLTQYAESVFADKVPLHIDVNQTVNFNVFQASAREVIDTVCKHKTYSRDVLARYPQLSKRVSTLADALSLSVTLVKRIENVSHNHENEKLQLELIIPEEGSEMVCVYNSSLFTRGLINRMLRQFVVFFQSIHKNPEQPVSQVSILDEKDQREILETFNNTDAAYEDKKTLSRLFEEQVVLTPNAIAAIDDSGELSYAQLNERANQLANALIENGFKRGQYAGIFIDRSQEMIIAVMGVLKAGGIYIPLETYLPEKRLIYILDSLQVGSMVTNSLQLDKIYTAGDQLPSLKTIYCLTSRVDGNLRAQKSGKRIVTYKDIESKQNTNPSLALSSDDIAYVIFTSGSTGTPKGVVVKHRPVINVIEWVNKTFHVSSADKILFVASLSFDLSVYDIFGILAAGGTIRIISGEKIREPEYLLNVILDEDITFWDSAPEVLQQVTPYFDKVKGRGTSFRLVFLSGDWIPVMLPDALKDTFANVKVISLGGATEATIWSNYYPVEKVNPSWKSIPYGKPIQNAKYYILDHHLLPSPIGIPGDLYIGGKCLAEGYINDEALTASKFIDNPFLNGDKLYRTGDMARWFEDGNMEFLGRKDFQVKIRGYRVELGEIESLLLKYNGIKEAIVMVKSISESDKRLVAYFIAQETISINDLRKYLRELIPDYMVPAHFLQLKKFPLSAVGKVDRNALLDLKDITSSDNFIPPSTKLEQQLAEIWQESLGIERVGLADNFFDLGGHSLLVIKTRFKLKQVFGEEPSFLDFMNLPFGQFVRVFEKKINSEKVNRVKSA